MFHIKFIISIRIHRICGVIVTVMDSSVIECGVVSQSDQMKDYKIGIRSHEIVLVHSDKSRWLSL